MKLKSKLVPLASIAATVATIAPISLTSCGTQLNGGTFNLVNGYTSRFDRLPQNVMQMVEMNNAFSEHLKQNPESFIDDLLWSKANLGSGFEELIYMYYQVQNILRTTSEDIDTVGMATSGVRFGPSSSMYNYENIWVSDFNLSFSSFKYEDTDRVIEFEAPVVSIKINFDSEMKPFDTKMLGISGYEITGKTKGYIQFKDFPFWVYPRDLYFPFFDPSMSLPLRVNCCMPFIEWIEATDERQEGFIPYEFMNKFEAKLDIQADLTITQHVSRTQEFVRNYSFVDQTIANAWNMNISPLFETGWLQALAFGPTTAPVYLQRIVCINLWN